MDIIVTIFKFYLLYILTSLVHRVIKILELRFIFLSKRTIFNKNISYVKKQK